METNSLDFAPAGIAGTGQQPGYQCRTCSYGTSLDVPPPSCPMCHDGAWVKAIGNGRAFTVRRLAATTVLISPPAELDLAASTLLWETVACLAFAHPEVVVDLTDVDEIDEGAAQLLSRLGELARFGERVLVAVPTAGPKEIEILELETSGSSTAGSGWGRFSAVLRTLVSRAL